MRSRPLLDVRNFR